MASWMEKRGTFRRCSIPLWPKTAWLDPGQAHAYPKERGQPLNYTIGKSIIPFWEIGSKTTFNIRVMIVCLGCENN